MGQTKLLKLPRGVTIRKHRRGETINITFTYKGVKCREPLSNLEVTPRTLNTPSAHSAKFIIRSKGEHLFMRNIFPVLLVENFW